MERGINISFCKVSLMYEVVWLLIFIFGYVSLFSCNKIEHTTRMGEIYNKQGQSRYIKCDWNDGATEELAVTLQ